MATQVTVTTLAEGATTNDLVNALLGGSSGVTVSNVTYSGNIAQGGTFTGVGSGIFDSGIIFSSGNANDAEKIRTLSASTDFNTSSGALNDPVSLGFDIVATGTQIVFNYRVGTKESLGSSYTDPFTLTLDGTNIALLPNGNPVTITNLSVASGYGVSNSTGQFGAVYSGYSIALTATATVTPGQTYHLTFNVADGGDHVQDTAAFIQGGSLRSNSAPSLTTPLVDQGAVAGAAFTYAVPGGSFTDADTGDTLTYSARQTNGSALPAWLSFDASTQIFTGTPPAGVTGTVSVRVTATDTGGLTKTDDFDIAVALSVNHAPSFTGTAVGATLVQGGSVALAGSVAVSDIDSATFSGASLTVAVTAGSHAGDVVSIAATSGITVSGASVDYNGAAIGTVSGGNGSPLVVTLGTGVAAAAIAALTQAITLSNAISAVTNDTRTVTFTLNDGGGTANGGHDTMSFQVAVAASDPAPSVVGIAASPTSGVHGLGSSVLLTVSTSEAVTVSGTPSLLLSDGGSAVYVSGSGTGTLVFSHTVAAGHNAADLIVTGIDLAGGSIRDGAGQNLQALPSGGIDPAGVLTIDTAAPGAPVLSLVHDTGASASDLITSDAHIAVVTAETGGTLAYSLDGGAYAASYDPSALLDGKHTLSVTQTDAGGNVSTAGSIGFTLSRSAPSVTISGVSGGNNVVDHVVSGTVDVAHAGTLVTVADAGTVLGTATVQSDGTWALPVLFTGEGATHVYQLTATDMDLAGNTGSASFQFALDFTGNTGLFGSTGHAGQPQGSAAVVGALYDAIFGRAPDARGWEGWVPALDRGMSVHDLAANLLSSGEFANHFGAYTSGSDADFVNHLYETALSRNADTVGLQHWTGALAAGTSRADVAVGIAFSEENAVGPAAYVPDSTSTDVARLYYELLGRAPDATGLSHLSTQVHGGASLASVAGTLISSVEFGAAHGSQQTDEAFVQDLYQNALGRTAEGAGAQSWLDALTHGATRADVAVGIAESAEAVLHLAGRIEAGWHLHS